MSGDESEPAFDAFFKDMSCGAIAFDDSDAREALESRLDITEYPTLVMLGPKPEDDDTKHDSVISSSDNADATMVMDLRIEKKEEKSIE